MLLFAIGKGIFNNQNMNVTVSIGHMTFKTDAQAINATKKAIDNIKLS